MVTCKACMREFPTTVRGNTVRCPSCKVANWVPKNTATSTSATTVRPVAAVAVTGWHPTPVEVEPEWSDEECGCGTTPLAWEPAGTLLWCHNCEEPVFPPGLVPTAPDDVDRADPRRVMTQAERDDEALALAKRRAVALDAVRHGLRDDKLHPESRGVLEWYGAEFGQALNMARVDELVERLGSERIRRRGWFSGDAVNPAEIVDAEIVDDDEAYDEYDQAPAADHMLAIEAPRPAVDVHAALAVRGWQLDQDAPPGYCRILARSHWSGDPDYHLCGGAGTRALGHALICQSHYDALTRPLPGS